jgi:CDP-diacylglycerol--serine O-phosphatidyltransferase
MNLRVLLPFGITASILWLGFQAILSAFAGDFSHAAQLIVLGAMLDGIDGEVARRVRGATKFGERLDSYVDVVTFGLAPAYLAYHAFWNQFGTAGVAIAFLYILSGVIRFSRANVTEEKGNRHCFRGLPIPHNAMWVAMLILVSNSTNPWVERSGLSYDIFFVLAWACSLVFILLQVSNVGYVKPRKDTLMLAISVMLVLMLLTRRPAPVFAVTFFILFFTYAFVTPLLARRAQRAMADQEEDEEEEPAHLER